MIIEEVKMTKKEVETKYRLKLNTTIKRRWKEGKQEPEEQEEKYEEAPYIIMKD